MKEKEIKFVRSWEKTRSRGKWMYILTWTLIFIVGCLFGKTIGEYFSYGIWLMPFCIADFIALGFLSILGLFLITKTWNRSEVRYTKLMENQKLG